MFISLYQDRQFYNAFLISEFFSNKKKVKYYTKVILYLYFRNRKLFGVKLKKVSKLKSLCKNFHIKNIKKIIVRMTKVRFFPKLFTEIYETTKKTFKLFKMLLCYFFSIQFFDLKFSSAAIK